MARNFLNTADYPLSELRSIINSAFEFKAGRVEEKLLARKSVGLVFFDPSLRTRASMQVAVNDLGGFPIAIEPGTTSWSLEHLEGIVMDGAKTEHLKEFVRVLARYVSIIGVRTFAQLADWESERTDPILRAFAGFSTVPIINLESAMHHPCQAMADMMTIAEKQGAGKKKVVLTWAWHPKPLPMAVPNSFALAAAQFGHDLTIVNPKGYNLDHEILRQIEQEAAFSGGSINFTENIDTAFDRAEVVYAKSWGAKEFYGDSAREIHERAPLRDKWIVDEAKMSRTADAIFMHCLPVRRNVVVTDGVIDSPRSVVVDQAENRLHVQKAILQTILK